MASPLLTKKTSTTNRIFILSTKYMTLKKYFEENPDEKPTEKEQKFLNNVLEELGNLTTYGELWSRIKTDVNERVEIFKKAYSHYNRDDIAKLAGKVKSLGGGWRKYLTLEEKEFIKCCDMLRETARFMKDVLNKNIKNKIDDKFINNLTNQFVVKEFFAQVGEDRVLNSFAEGDKFEEEKEQDAHTY